MTTPDAPESDFNAPLVPPEPPGNGGINGSGDLYPTLFEIDYPKRLSR